MEQLYCLQRTTISIYLCYDLTNVLVFVTIVLKLHVVADIERENSTMHIKDEFYS